MKKMFLTIMVAALPAISQAQQAWEKEFSTLETTKEYQGTYAPVKAPSAISPAGIIYQTGRYDMPIMLGDSFLDNIATSAFLSALDVDGKNLWAVGLKGAARITTCISDIEGNVYVAGIFADDLILESTDFTEQNLIGSPATHEMASAFIARYTKAGVLTAAKAIQMLPNELLAGNENYEFDGTFTPGSLCLSQGRIYLSASYSGTFEVDDVKHNSSYINGMGALFDASALCVLSFEANTLNDAKQELDMNNATMEGASDSSPRSLTLANDGDEVVVALISTGNAILHLANKTTILQPGDDMFASTIIRLNAGEVKVLGISEGDRYWYANEVNAMEIRDGKIYLAGTFSSPLAFAGDCCPSLWADQWMSCLDKQTYEVLWSKFTEAKRDDMPDTNSKYRYTNQAALLPDGSWTSVGTTLFSIDAEGVTHISQDKAYLAISSRNGLSAFTTLTASGSLLSVSGTFESNVSFPSEAKENELPDYLISGVKAFNNQRGIIIRGGRKISR